MPINHSTPKPIQVAAAVVGNALEWYDFIAFGFLTVVIARLFFPAESQYASLLLTTATFGVGFFMRPVGGILLGLYADHKGRKSALLLIIVLMTVAIAMIGFAPTYAAIGVAAPLIIVLARLLQGLATGGEFASATSFLIESAPPIGEVLRLLPPGFGVYRRSAPYTAYPEHSQWGCKPLPLRPALSDFLPAAIRRTPTPSKKQAENPGPPHPRTTLPRT